MKIGMITAWNTHCGVSEFARNLSESILKLGEECRIIPVKDAFSDSFVDCDILFVNHTVTPPNQNSIDRNVMWIEECYLPLDRKPKLFILTDACSGVGRLARGIDHFRIAGLIVNHEQVHSGKRVFPLPHGLPSCEERSKEEARRILDIEATPVLSSFGSLWSSKRFGTIVAATAEVQKTFPDVMLVLCCSTASYSKYLGDKIAIRIERLIENLKVNATLLRDKWDDYMMYLQSSDLFIVQGMYPKKMISGSCLTGFSARRPTILNRTFGYVQAEPYSLVIEKPEPDLLADAIVFLLEDRKEYGHYEKLAKEAYSLFNWDVVASQYLELFRKALN